jgi:integrase/recombinase XerD
MLERYFVKPSTVDRIRGNVAGAYIEHYVEWMHKQGYAARNVHCRVPMLCQFGQFASLRGAFDGGSALAHVEAFAVHWQALHGKTCKSADARAKVAQVARGPVRQMLELALRGSVEPHRQRKAFPFEADAPGFANYLREERGLKEATVSHYAHFLGGFSDFLRRVNSEPLTTLSPALLAAFIVDRCPGLARTSRRDLCGALRVFLRYCYREGLVEHDLSTSVEMPRTYRLADVPRSITWDEVRRMLACVDRRAVVGRRDYAILLLLVTYGLRANEVAKLTLDDIDWKRERLSVPLRKAGHWSAYPLAGVVGEAIIDYLKDGRPETTDRHVFFRTMTPRSPICAAAITSAAAKYLHRAGVQVHRPGAHTAASYAKA